MLYQIEKGEVMSANIILLHVPEISPQLLPAMLLQLVLDFQSYSPLPWYVQETTYPVSDTYRIQIRQGYVSTMNRE